jgi:hypothetical protein
MAMMNVGSLNHTVLFSRTIGTQDLPHTILISGEVMYVDLNADGKFLSAGNREGEIRVCSSSILRIRVLLAIFNILSGGYGIIQTVENATPEGDTQPVNLVVASFLVFHRYETAGCHVIRFRIRIGCRLIG